MPIYALPSVYDEIDLVRASSRTAGVRSSHWEAKGMSDEALNAWIAAPADDIALTSAIWK